MPIRYDELMALKNLGQKYAYTDREVMLYAYGIGLGADPMDEKELAFVNEAVATPRALKVVPTFASVAAWGAGPGEMNLNRVMVVDGERDITFHKPLATSAHITADSTVLDVFDKGKDKGAVIRHQTVLRDDKGEKLATLVASRFARGDGGFGGPSEGQPEPHKVPTRAPDKTVEITTRPDQALVYRLCGDRNPLHSDPEFAKRAGFPRPILHGMCTYGISCRGVLQTYADYDPAAFRQHAARFSSPVYPGETVTMELWKDGNVISFEAKVKTRDVIVIKSGRTVLGYDAHVIPSSCPSLVPGIHDFSGNRKDVDGRDSPAMTATDEGAGIMGLLDGKVALITGAGGGLGEAYAKLFAREGAAVVVNDLGGPRDGSGGDASMAQKVVDAIKAQGGRAVANGADISTMAGGQSVFDDAIRNFGRVDILVNNAGILLDQTFAKASEAAWDKVIKVHLKGTFCCTQPVFRWMRENGGGVIVNTSSTSGLIGNFGQTNYGAAKGGIWGLSNVLAIEGRKYNIRVWTLAPGALTRMTADLPRYIENPGAALGPDGIAPAVLYMVSDLSGDQTGKVLGVSGPRGVREMRMMEMEGWKPPHTGWKAQDVVAHAREIFFSEEQIKMGARRF